MDFVFKTDASHTGKAAIEGVNTIDDTDVLTILLFRTNNKEGIGRS